ncbi:hypothetical protein [Methanococcoides sp. AM1]|uniref:hypothetical protein n=1 Tax=Methanococcoides sp. AM1 TaxID=1201011 RepID=UPI00108303FA|nr:hypothetical protein [Methanococcoides sp. AM1]
MRILYKIFARRYVILLVVLALTLMCSFSAYASDIATQNGTYDSTTNENISNKNNSQLPDNDTNSTTNVVTGNTESTGDVLDIKINVLNQLIQSIILLFTIIITIGIAIHQVLEPKYHPLLKTLLFKRMNGFFLALILLFYFAVLAINFYHTPTSRELNIELPIIFLPIFFLLFVLYKLLCYSNKSTLIELYLKSLSSYDIFSEVCNKFEYPKEENISGPLIALKHSYYTFQHTDDDEKVDLPTFAENIKRDGEKIRKLNLDIRTLGQESDLESVFDILALAIEKSEYKFFSKCIDKMNEKIFPILLDNALNDTIKENIVLLIIENYTKLAKISIHEENYHSYTILIHNYEKIGKILIDTNDFKNAKKIVDCVGTHSFDLNSKTFHVDYSYKGNDCIFNLINYYIDKESYDDQKIQRWLEIIGAIAEDIVNVDYQIKHRSIRDDYTSKTESDYNPVNQIINDLELLNTKIIKKITPINDVSKNGENLIETISLILKQITMELLKRDDYSTTYNVYSAYGQIARAAIGNEVHYAIHYIIDDLHKIGNEIIIKEWPNNSNALLFDIAELGVFAENKELINAYEPKEYWFYNFAEVLKHLYERFVDVFVEEPHQKYPSDFFMELGIVSDSTNFENYYKLCKPDEHIWEDVKEGP